MRSWKWLVLGGLIALIIYFSSTTVVTQRQLARFVSGAIPGVTEDGFYEWWQTWWWVFVKGFHVLEFFLLALALGWGLLRMKEQRFLVIGAGLAVIWACLDEWHQSFVPSRGGRFSDVLIDCLGTGLPVLVILRWRIKNIQLDSPSTTDLLTCLITPSSRG